MRKIKYLIIGALLFLPIKSKALGGNYSLSCGKSTLKVGEETTCYVSGSFNSDIAGAEVGIKSSGNISISNINSGSGFTLVGNNPSALIVNGNANANSSVTFITFKAKLTSDSSNSYVSTTSFSSSSLNDLDDTYDAGGKTYSFTVKKEESKTEIVQNDTPSINKVTTTSQTTNKEKTTTTQTTNKETKKEDTKKSQEDNKKDEEEKKKQEEAERKKKEAEEKKKKEEAEKNKQELEKDKQVLTTSTTTDGVETVDVKETNNVKSINSSRKSSSDILIFIATIVAVVLFVVVVGYTVYVKINEKNKKA